MIFENDAFGTKALAEFFGRFVEGLIQDMNFCPDLLLPCDGFQSKIQQPVRFFVAG